MGLEMADSGLEVERKNCKERVDGFWGWKWQIWG